MEESKVEFDDSYIAGVLNLNGPIMGKTKNGAYKIFKPANSKYPYLLVSTRKTQQETDIYAIIKFKEWGKRYPIGVLHNKIGDIANYEDEKEYLLYRNNIKFKKYKEIDVHEYLIDLTPNRELIEYDIFSIDPDGCKDIDDALHYYKTEDYIEIGIHIADVSSFISVDSNLEIEISKRCESQYLDWIQNNMFPNELVELMSLSDNKESRAFSVIIKFDDDCNIIDYEFKKTLIQVNYNLSYETANEYLNNIEHPISQLYRIANILYDRKYNTDIIKEPFDIHKMVEVYMILTNVLAANKIKEIGLYTPISRIHNNIDMDLECESNIASKINIYHTEKAKYILGEGEHGGLNEKLYTHFTSPIRRYMDIIIHRMLYNSISGINSEITINNLEQQITIINQLHNNIKKAERESILLRQIYELYQENITEVDTYGYVVSIFNNTIKIHVPEMNIDVNCEFYNSVFEIQSNDIKISIIKNDIDICYNLGDQVQLKVVITYLDSNFNKKILGQLKLY